MIRLPRASDDAAGEASIAGLHRVGPTFLIADVDENESASKEKCSPISDHDRSALRAHFAHPTSPADRSRGGEVWDLRARSAHRTMFANCQWADPTDAEGWMPVQTDPGYRSPRDASIVRSLVVATRFEFLAERYSLLGSGVADQAVAPIALRAGR